MNKRFDLNRCITLNKMESFGGLRATLSRMFCGGKALDEFGVLFLVKRTEISGNILKPLDFARGW